MTLSHSERQGNLYVCCPINTGSSRQFWVIVRQYSALLWWTYSATAMPCGFPFLSPVRRDGYSLKSASRHEQSALLISACRSVFLCSRVPTGVSHRSPNASDASPPQNSSHVFSSESDFHRASTFFFVASSIRISSGHGRANPSDSHLRVASIPIFDPKSCIRAA